MKWMIASDIHGSAYYCEQVKKAFIDESADRLILLGDLLYHGPRNALPKDYDPQKTADILNSMKDSILCVRGNCDAEVDQLVLDFPIMADYMLLPVEKRLVFVTHGHVYNESSLPPLKKGDILLHGHTHVTKCTKHEDYTYINPGSAAIPKEGTLNGYMILEGSTFFWKDFDRNVLMTYDIGEN